MAIPTDGRQYGTRPKDSPLKPGLQSQASNSDVAGPSGQTQPGTTSNVADISKKAELRLPILSFGGDAIGLPGLSTGLSEPARGRSGTYTAGSHGTSTEPAVHSPEQHPPGHHAPRPHKPGHHPRHPPPGLKILSQYMPRHHPPAHHAPHFNDPRSPSSLLPFVRSFFTPQQTPPSPPRFHHTPPSPHPREPHTPSFLPPHLRPHHRFSSPQDPHLVPPPRHSPPATHYQSPSPQQRDSHSPSPFNFFGIRCHSPNREPSPS